MGFLSAGLVFTTSSVNTLVYSPRGEEEAAAAGFILLSMVAVGGNVLWLVAIAGLTLFRLSGSSTLDPHPKPAIAAISIHLPCTKNNAGLCAIVGQ